MENFVKFVKKTSETEPFCFSGRGELFRPPVHTNQDEIFEIIEKKLIKYKLTDEQVSDLQKSVCNYVEREIAFGYRSGFAKGCLSGAVDVCEYVKENSVEDFAKIVKDAQSSMLDMCNCIPAPKSSNQIVKSTFQKNVKKN